MRGNTVSRREFLRLAGKAGAAVGLSAGMGGLLAACGEEGATTTTQVPATAALSTTATSAGASTSVSAAAETGRPIKIGLVSAATGSLAFFAMSEKWWIPHFQKAVAQGVVCGDGKNHTFEIISQDSQSDSARAAQVAGDLIMNQKIDLIMAMASPNIGVPVSSQAEALGCPCLLHFTVPEAHATTAPAEGMKWTYMQTWSSMAGVVQQEAAFALLSTNKKVAFAAPNNDDGMSWEKMAPPYFEEKGYEVVYKGLYQPGTEDFNTDIALYKKSGCELLLHAGAVPADFATLWQQCYQQAFHPKAVTGGAAIMFPSSLNAISAIAENLMVQGGWTPDLKFKDSLTGQTCAELAAEFEEVLGVQWDLTITCYAPAEWAVDIFKRSADIESKDETIKSLLATKMENILGPLDMTVAPDAKNQTRMGRWHPNMVQPPAFAVQWQKGKGKWPFDQVIVYSLVPDLVQPTGEMLPMKYS